MVGCVPQGEKPTPVLSSFRLTFPLCLALTHLPTLTHTGWCRDIPLGQCPRYREALDLWGPLKGIARVAFEANDGSYREVTAKPLSIARFWHRTALCGAGSGYRCGEEGHSVSRLHPYRNWSRDACRTRLEGALGAQGTLKAGMGTFQGRDHFEAHGWTQC